MSQGRPRNEAGFTLLEVIVALVVMGVLLATLSQGVHFGFTAWGRQMQARQTSEALQATDRTLRRLIEETDPGTGPDAAKLVGRAGAVALTSELPIGPGGAMRTADIRLLVDREGRLVLSWLPHLHVHRLRAAPPPHLSILLSGLQRLELGYWSAAKGGWQRDWKDNGLPDLIRIRLVFRAGDTRHWPDIVDAPRREPPA